jgi:hypothetical protein
MRQNKRHLPKFLRNYDKDDNDWLDEREIQAIPKGELGKNTKKTAYLLILEILSAAKIARQALVPTEGVSFDEYRILMRLNAASVKNGKANGKDSLRNQEYLADELGLSASRISSLLASMDESRAASDAGRGTQEAVLGLPDRKTSPIIGRRLSL